MGSITQLAQVLNAPMSLAPFQRVIIAFISTCIMYTECDTLALAARLITTDKYFVRVILHHQLGPQRLFNFFVTVFW